MDGGVVRRAYHRRVSFKQLQRLEAWKTPEYKEAARLPSHGVDVVRTNGMLSLPSLIFDEADQN